MYPSFWKLYLDDFFFFLVPLQLIQKPSQSCLKFGDDGDDDLSHHYLPNFKQLQLGFQTSQRGTKKKENHLHTISKMMGTLVHVQLYTFSYRKPVIRPQNMPKTADWGQKRSKLWYFKMGPEVQPKCFRHAKHTRNNRELRKRGYLIRFGHTEALLLKKKGH